MENIVPMIVLIIGLGLAALAVLLLVNGKGAITSLGIGASSTTIGIIRIASGLGSSFFLITGITFILVGLIATRIDTNSKEQTYQNRHTILDIVNGVGND